MCNPAGSQGAQRSWRRAERALPLTAKGAALFLLSVSGPVFCARDRHRMAETKTRASQDARARPPRKRRRADWNSCYATGVGYRPDHPGRRQWQNGQRRRKPAKKPAAKRELISPRGDKRYIRRDAAGRIRESDDVSRSLSQDRRRKAKKAAKSGQGDRGDRKPASKASARKKTRAKR